MSNIETLALAGAVLLGLFLVYRAVTGSKRSAAKD